MVSSPCRTWTVRGAGQPEDRKEEVSISSAISIMVPSSSDNNEGSTPSEAAVISEGSTSSLQLSS